MTAPARPQLGSWLALAAGLLAAASLVWFLGPLLVLAGWRPLASVAARALLAAGLLLLPLAAALWRWQRARLQARRATQVADAIDAEVDQALLRLRARPAITATGWRGLWARWQQLNAPDPLLALPWVLVVGMPGADTRRMLMRQGYPLAPLPAQAPEPPCTWCIAPGVVLVVADWAALQAHDRGWSRLLARLARARPLQPLNAVLVLAGRASLQPGPGGPSLRDGVALQAALAALPPALGMLPALQLAWLDNTPAAAASTARQAPGASSADLRLLADTLAGPLRTALGSQHSEAWWPRPPLGTPQLPPAQVVAADATGLRACVDRLLQFLHPSVRAPRYARGHLRRRRWLVGLAYAGTVLLALGLGAGWWTSRAQNLALIASQEAAVAEAQQALAAGQAAVQGDDLEALVVLLTGIRNKLAPDDAADWRAGLGLSQRDRLQAMAQAAEARLLREVLVPALTRRLAARLRSQLAAAAPDIDVVCATLNLYLMLAQPAGSDRMDVRTLVAQAAVLMPQADPAVARQLGALVAALAESGGGFGAQDTDVALVDQARQFLAGQPLPVLVNSLVRAQRGYSAQPLAELADVADLSLFTRASGRPLQDGVPRVYTRQGVNTLVQRILKPDTLAGIREALGQPALSADAAADQAVLTEAARLYAQDYIAAWSDLLADLRLAAPADAAAAQRLADRLEGADSPLRALLRGVRNQVTPGQLQGLPAAAAPLAQIDAQFAGLARLLDGQPPPLDAALSLMAQRLRDPGAAGDGLAALKAAAYQLPQPLRNLLAQQLPGGAGAASADPAAAADARAAAAYAALKQQCQRSAAGRYPLVAGAQAEMAPDDFAALFGPGGAFDAFYRQQLAPLVDTSRATWAWAAGSAARRPVPDAALASFQQAAQIRQVFFSKGDRQPALRVSLALQRPQFDGSPEAIELRLDNRVVLLLAGKGSVAVDWPGQPPLQRLGLGLQGAKAPALAVEGAWTLPRLLDRLTLQPTRVPGGYRALLSIDGQQAVLGVGLSSALALGKAQLRAFQCPPAASR